jgi:hypothetical protein
MSQTGFITAANYGVSIKPARIASLSSLISWAVSSRLASLPLPAKERLLFLPGTSHFLD